MNGKEIVKNNLKTAIRLLGGIKAVSDRFDIPYRTVQNWSDGTRTPPNYVYRMIIEVEKQDRKDDESYKNYVVLQEQFDAMAELAQKRREEIEANEAAIDQLEKALNATREELAKERHAREVWARQAGMLTRR